MRDYSTVDMEWILAEGLVVNASSLYWIIVYPSGDRTRLALAKMRDSYLSQVGSVIHVDLKNEEGRYDMASRKRFRDENMAHKYGLQLAKQNRLQFESEIGILD